MATTVTKTVTEQAKAKPKRKSRAVKIEAPKCMLYRSTPCCGMLELGNFNGSANPFAHNPKGVVKYLRTSAHAISNNGKLEWTAGQRFGPNITLFHFTQYKSYIKGWVDTLKKGGAKIILEYDWISKHHKSKLTTVMFR